MTGVQTCALPIFQPPVSQPGIAKQDRKRRNVGLKILVTIILIVLALSGAGFNATSPGNTTTETPRLSTALRMAIARTWGICSGLETSSQ